MTALRMSAPVQRTFRGEALARLAELRLAQGRIEEAEGLVEGFEDHPAAAAATAAIKLARGEPGQAAAILRRRASVLDEPSLESAAPLELLVEAEVAQGATDVAAGKAKRLAELGARLGCDAIVARGQRALGRAATAAGDAASAQGHLASALAAFCRLGCPSRRVAPASFSRRRFAMATGTPRSSRLGRLSASSRISAPPTMRTPRRRSCARWASRRRAPGAEASAARRR